jgi:4-oxalocrotonate tautomerase
MNSSINDIAATLQIYFDGLYHCDSKILAKVFHPEAHYFCATEGKLLHLDMLQYFPVVDQRQSPASKNEARADRIISIEFAGPVTAFARVECAIRPRFFTDFLTFTYLDGRWQIVSKVFHFDLKE